MQPERKLFGLAKLYVCLSALHTFWAHLSGMSEPDHTIVLMTTVLFVSLGVWDALVNDLMPDHFIAPAVFRWKYVIFIALAGGQMSLIYDAVMSYRTDFSTLRYALDAAAAVGVAVLDLKSRWVARNESSAVSHSVS